MDGKSRNVFKEKEKKILVVDDEKDVRDVLYDLLTFEGFDVETVEDGETALEKLLRTHYDLLITDLNMPKMDGIELLDRIFENKVEVTAIVMSSFIPQLTIEYIKRRNIDGQISKPFKMDEMMAIVERGLGINSNKDSANSDMNSDSTQTHEGLLWGEDARIL